MTDVGDAKGASSKAFAKGYDDVIFHRKYLSEDILNIEIKIDEKMLILIQYLNLFKVNFYFGKISSAQLR